jgi:hypothetical protein
LAPLYWQSIQPSILFLPVENHHFSSSSFSSIAEEGKNVDGGGIEHLLLLSCCSTGPGQQEKTRS